MSEHIDFEMLNDYADDRLSAAERAIVDAHVAGCGGCRGELIALGRVLELASAAPRAIEPPADDWPALRAELARRKDVVLPTRGFAAAPAWRRRVALAAAALLLIASSSAVTAIVLRQRMPEPVVVQAPARGGSAVPSSYSATEASYLRTLAELSEALDAQRSTLAPSTIATVERSLRVIDQAITEARDALASDPGNGALVDILSANYERKLELLKRAAELSSHI